MHMLKQTLYAWLHMQNRITQLVLNIHHYKGIYARHMVLECVITIF